MNDLWAPKIYSTSGFNRDIDLGSAKALDVGCGGRKLPGSVGLDRLALPGVDIVHDADQMPWPFRDDDFDLVLMNQALEHVADVVSVMGEVHRILKPAGRAVIQVPYFRTLDAYTDPTHTHFFTAGTLDYFLAQKGLAQYGYSGGRLFIKKGFWYGWPHPSRSPIRKLLKRFAHAYPSQYDQYLSLLFPVACLTWELEAIK